MLIRYKKNQEKIAMGLLSFMPIEKEIKYLQQTIGEYENNADWRLYLWKEENDIVGIVGLKIEDELNVVVQHISVNPSYRSLGIGKKMIDEVIHQYGEKYDVCADEFTQQFFNRCTHNIESDEVDD